jgi:hypothetical protein
MGSVTYHPLCDQNICDGTNQVADVFNQVHGLETLMFCYFAAPLLILVVFQAFPNRPAVTQALKFHLAQESRKVVHELNDPIPAPVALTCLFHRAWW